jgi:hypothetical protein
VKALLLLSYSHSAPILYIQPTAIGEYLERSFENMDNKDFHSIIRNALTNYLFELNQSCYEQPECKKATSKCVDYLDSNLIDEQWLLNNHLVVYSACCCYHKSLDSSIKEAHVSSDEESLAKLRKEREVIIRLKMFYKNHHLDFNNPLL